MISTSPRISRVRYGLAGSGTSKAARGRAIRFLAFRLEVFSDSFIGSSSARKATMVLYGQPSWPRVVRTP